MAGRARRARPRRARVRNGVEERDGEADVVAGAGPGRRAEVELVEPAPQNVGGAVEPGMLHAERVQRRRVGRGLGDRGGVGGLPPRAARMALDGRQAERDAAARGRSTLPSQSAAPRIIGVVVDADLVEDLHGRVDPDRLAVRRAHVGLDRVAEPAVGVAMGAQGLHDRLGVAAVRAGAQAVAVEQAAVGLDEGGGGVDVGVHAASVASDGPSVLNESDLSPAGPAPEASSAAGGSPDSRVHSRVRCAWSA